MVGDQQKDMGPPVHLQPYFITPQSETEKTEKVKSRSHTEYKSYMGTTNEHSNFLYVFFFFAYYAGLAPFRFKKIDHGEYKVHRWLPQKILCAIVTTLAMLRLFTTLRTSIANITNRDPLTFFKMFAEVSSFVFKASVLIGFWAKRIHYFRLISFLTCPHLLPYNSHKFESVKAIGFFCGSFVFFGIIRTVLGSGVVNIWEWSPSWWYRRLVAEGRYTFFIANSTNFETAPELSEITTLDIILAIIQGFSIQWRLILGFYADLCILLHILTLWAPATAFGNSLYSEIPLLNDTQLSEQGKPTMMGFQPSSDREELDLVIKRFWALKRLSVVIAEAIGHTILPYIGEALFYYAIYFDVALLTPDIMIRLSLMFFYVFAVCILTFSAEISRKVRWLKAWLCEERRLPIVDQNVLAVILDDLTSHSVGISATGIFTLNYQFVGMVISVLITYFIIRLQSKVIVQPF